MGRACGFWRYAGDVGEVNLTESELAGAPVHAVAKGCGGPCVPCSQQFGDVVPGWNQERLQRLILGELLAGGHREDGLAIRLLAVKDRDVLRRDRNERSRLVKAKVMILKHQQCR